MTEERDRTIARVADHIAVLRNEFGHTIRSIARASDCTWKQVNKIARREVRWIGEETALRILAVPLVPLVRADGFEGEYVPALGAVRRLRGLAVMGWTAEQIAGRCPTLTAGAIRAIQRRAPARIRRDRSRETAHVYRVLVDKTPVGPYAEHVRAMALARGWFSPGEWDDPDTDVEPQPEYWPIVEYVAAHPWTGATELWAAMRDAGMTSIDFRALLDQALADEMLDTQPRGRGTLYHVREEV